MKNFGPVEATTTDNSAPPSATRGSSDVENGSNAAPGGARSRIGQTIARGLRKRPARVSNSVGGTAAVRSQFAWSVVPAPHISLSGRGGVRTTPPPAAPVSVQGAQTSTRNIAAIERQRRPQVSLWDAIILRSARETGCAVVCSEDLPSGAVQNGIQMLSPFVGGVRVAGPAARARRCATWPRGFRSGLPPPEGRWSRVHADDIRMRSWVQPAITVNRGHAPAHAGPPPHRPAPPLTISDVAGRAPHPRRLSCPTTYPVRCPAAHTSRSSASHSARRSIIGTCPHPDQETRRASGRCAMKKAASE